MKVLVAGDIGGTKTILALYSPEQGFHEPLRRSSYPSRAYASLEDILAEFIGSSRGDVAAAVFGVAGPVVDGTARITNLPWIVDARSLVPAIGTETIHLINDLEAVALGIPLLDERDFITINQGEPDPRGTIAVIAPGTGLGEAYLTWDGLRHRAHASEGGHADFAPRDHRERDLLSYLLERHDHVSYERVCSGSGIPNIYTFLRDRCGFYEPAWLSEKLREAQDPTIVIRETAQDPAMTCELCSETMRMFVSILGAESGNLALKLLPSGGIYVAGGLPPRMVPMLREGPFLASFHAKGRLSHMVGRMPVHVVLNTDVGLMGAAGHGMDMILRQ